MSTPTAQSANVCTAEAPLFLRAHIDYMPQVDSERRFWIVDTRAPSDIPPPAALHFDDVLLPRVEQIERLRNTDPNCIWIGVNEVNDVLLTRHHDESTHEYYPERTNKWAGHMIRHDEVGRRWNRNVTCVVNDFGWLVEVTTC